MENIKKLNFKSKNYSEIFQNDINLLNKESFSYTEMDEIERIIILKFKINYPKEYLCLNNENFQDNEIIEKSKKKIKKNKKIKLTSKKKDVSLYKEKLIKKMNSHLDKIKKLAHKYNKICSNNIEENQFLKNNNFNIDNFSTAAKENDLSPMSEYDYNFELNKNNIFSLFNNENVEEFCCKTFTSNEEIELKNTCY